VVGKLRVSVQEVCCTGKSISLAHSLLSCSDFGCEFFLSSGNAHQLLYLCLDLNLELAANGFGSAETPCANGSFVRSSVLFFWKSATHTKSASSVGAEANINTFASEEVLILPRSPLSAEALGSLSFTCSPRIPDEDASSRVQKALRAVLITQVAMRLTNKHLEVRQLASGLQRCRGGSSNGIPAAHCCARPPWRCCSRLQPDSGGTCCSSELLPSLACSLGART